MRNAALKFALSLALTIAGATAALSTDVSAVPGAGQTQGYGIRDFILANPDCLEFNDYCSFCSVVDGVAECSIAQIACMKQKNVCTKRASN